MTSKKGGLAALLLGKPEGESEGDEGEAYDAEAEQAAGAAVMAALKSGDEAGFTSALKDFVQLCK